MSARYQIQVRGQWAGAIGPTWRPAVDGTVNQTGLSAEEASTFDSYDEARTTVENVLEPEVEGRHDDGDIDVRHNAPQFRIVEVQT